MGVEGADLLAIAPLLDEEAQECLKEMGVTAPLHRVKVLKKIRALVKERT